jgi:hypothetical protein
MMRELGYCNGIENYSRVISGRPVGSPPMTLIDYFPDDFVLFVDDPEGMGRIVDAYGGAIRSQARRLGLRIRKIAVRPATPEMAGCHSFQRQGRSLPLKREGR